MLSATLRLCLFAGVRPVCLCCGSGGRWRTGCSRTALFSHAFSIDEHLVVRGLDVHTDKICLLFGC